MTYDIKEHCKRYKTENQNKLIMKYREIFNDIDFSNLACSFIKICITKEVSEYVRRLRNNFRKNNKNKAEVGGSFDLDNNIIHGIKTISKGAEDSIHIDHKDLDDLFFHTHPNSFGIWNKMSPPSEFDYLNSLQLAINSGKSVVNLIWDKKGVYVYYFYPNFCKQIQGKNIKNKLEDLEEIYRYFKMGFGFYYKKKDFPKAYSSFSEYRNQMKKLGIYVDFKKYGQDICFNIRN